VPNLSENLDDFGTYLALIVYILMLIYPLVCFAC